MPTISTLCPGNLKPSDFFVLAGKLRQTFHTKFSARGGEKKRLPVSLYYRPYRLDHDDDMGAEDEGMTTATSARNVASKVGLGELPFPRDARGFLYLHKPQPGSGLPLLASWIRFRCTPSLEGSSSAAAQASTTHLLPPPSTSREVLKAFEAGHDLNLPSREPWGIPIVLVAGRKSLKYISRQLMKDELFTKDELRTLKNIYKNTYKNTGNSPDDDEG